MLRFLVKKTFGNYAGHQHEFLSAGHLGIHRRIGIHGVLDNKKDRLEPCRMFKGLFGGQTQQQAEVADIVSEEELPFPSDILDDTFLRGVFEVNPWLKM